MLLCAFKATIKRRNVTLEFNHKTVLLKETVELLNINPNGIYVDATAGGAGLSYEVASKLSKKGKLICIDQDPDAILACKEKLKEFKNVEIVNDNFSNIYDIVHNLGFDGIDGVVFDLGVSSYQLDIAERGFSYKKEAPLDMRMSKQGQSAYDVINFLDEDELRKIIKEYGEERYASKIAFKIVKARERKLIETTTELADIVKNAIPAFSRREGGNPARRTFQAIRIYVNDELENLKKSLENAFRVLKKGGRIVVITFHSLEDKIVKKKMQDWCTGCICPPDFPICVCGKNPSAHMISKKALKPSAKEVNENTRSRSAKLRVCEKI